MVNFILFILIVVGFILFVNSLSKFNIVFNSMDDRFYGYVVDADLQQKIKFVDRLRCLKYVFSLLVSLFLVLQVVSVIGSITYNVVPMSIIVLVTWTIYRLFVYFVFKKYKVIDLYNEIRKQWSTEKKVSKRHDEEVSLIRGVNDVQNLLFPSVCWLIAIVLTFV